MPKIHGTRKEKAAELLGRIKCGPSFSGLREPFTPEEASRQYRMWSESWIVEQLLELVPELKQKV